MKILLISPCKEAGLKKPRFLMIPQLALHLIAGLTPPEHEVRIVEEELEDIDLDEECSLVGISCMTSNAMRAYQLARWAGEIPIEYAYVIAALAAIATLIMLIKIKV